MAGVWMDQGLTDEAAGVIANPLNGAVVHLYQNNHAPAVGDTLAAFTESTFPGYAAQGPHLWTAGAIAGNNQPITAPAFQFTRGAGAGSQNVYGYYITDAGANLIAAELFVGGPFVMAIVLDQINLTLTETLTRV